MGDVNITLNRARDRPWWHVHLQDSDELGDPLHPVDVLVKTRLEEGRTIVTMVIVSAPDVTPTLLAKVPIGRIRRLIESAPEAPHSYVDATDGVTVFVKDDLSEAVLDELSSSRHVSANWPEGGWIHAYDSEKREPLTRPDGSGSDDFYRRVAAAYLDVTGRTRAVAPVLAEEAGVPVRTVHGWIRETRRRGFLPPSPRGGRS